MGLLPKLQECSSAVFQAAPWRMQTLKWVMSHLIPFHHPLKNIAALLLAKEISDVFTSTYCFSYYFKARWPNHRSCHITIVRQLRTNCPNSPSSVLIFLFCIYIVLFTVTLSWSQPLPLPSLLLFCSLFPHAAFRAGPFLCSWGYKALFVFLSCPNTAKETTKEQQGQSGKQEGRVVCSGTHEEALRVTLFTCSCSGQYIQFV